MCGIYGSFNLSHIMENEGQLHDRGSKIKTISCINKDKELIDVRVFAVDETLYVPVDIQMEALYYILHVLAPTTDTPHPHPALVRNEKTDSESALWHNGMIEAGDASKVGWDTKYMLWNLVNNAFVNEEEDFLSEFKGSFACLYLNDHQLVAFRNYISPMFFDKYGNVASVKINDTFTEMPANTVYDIFNDLNIVRKFNNTYDPYGLIDD
jgi:glutamine phosphoribosylpyrophosphate amidotransferase